MCEASIQFVEPNAVWFNGDIVIKTIQIRLMPIFVFDYPSPLQLPICDWVAAYYAPKIFFFVKIWIL